MPTPFPGTTAEQVVDAGVQTAPAGGSFLWFTVIALALVFVGYGIILAYHWFKYSEKKGLAVTSLVVYAGLGGFLLLILASIALATSL